MNYCSECGEEVDDTDKYCSECGHSLKDSSSDEYEPEGVLERLGAWVLGW